MVSGAHARFFHCTDDGTWIREARIQTLEPNNWIFEVEKFGHATRKIVQQTKLDRYLVHSVF